MMRLTGQQIFDATQVLATIINEKRALPIKGIYRVTRMHAKLFVEFSAMNDQRTAKIVSYDYKQPTIDGAVVPADTPGLEAMADVVMQDAVPADKMPEFVAWWKDLASIETDVNIEPIPIDQLSLGDDMPGTISFAEFAALGNLVSE